MHKLEYLSGSDEQDNEFFIESQAFFYQSQVHKTFTKISNMFDTFKKEITMQSKNLHVTKYMFGSYLSAVG